ncbi:FAD-binding oxidoreductase [Limnobacter sp.]|uniref:FAD-binding oxidoreductase n=1 Tax=Limnobacter sp. TaxID=2003368 RepID=UPI00391A1750
MNEFLEQLRKQVPGLLINTEAAYIAQTCTDWRKRYCTTALAVLEPLSTRQVQAIVKTCDAFNVAISTQGGNTGLVGGAVPLADNNAEKRPHVVLKTGRIREVLKLDESNLTLTASAGYTLHEIQEYAEAHGFLFPLSLASEGTCTLGGNLASNAGGVAVLRYGNTRELCLGLEYVNAQGELCGDLRGLRKNNTGYDLRHLLIGSEGTLGVVTTACMKVYPAPKSRCVAWLNVDNIQTAVDALSFVQSRLFGELSSYEWMNANAIDVVQSHFPARAPTCPGAVDHVLAEFTSLGSETALREQVTRTLEAMLEELPGVRNIAIAQSGRDIETFWALRENISEAQAKAGLNVKHDVACAVSQLPTFHNMALNDIAEHGVDVQPVLFGHLGDGNLHFNLSAPTGSDSAEFLKQHQTLLNNLVHDAILRCGGTVSAEHGIGQLKAELLRDITSASNYAAFKTIKQAMDPKNLLNPGKLVLL